jgi:hypothetical protein
VKISQWHITRVKNLSDEGKSLREIARETNLSHMSVKRILTPKNVTGVSPEENRNKTPAHSVIVPVDYCYRWWQCSDCLHYWLECNKGFLQIREKPNEPLSNGCPECKGKLVEAILK